MKTWIGLRIAGIVAVAAIASLISACNVGLLNLQAAAPTFTPDPGQYDTDITVQLSTATEGAIVYYTSDGSSPVQFGSAYTNPIEITGPETTVVITTFADADGLQASDEVSATYTVDWPDLTLDRTGDGTVRIDDSGTAGPEPVVKGEEVAITATAADNFAFDGWAVASDNAADVDIADPTAPSTTVSLNGGDATVTATFVLTASGDAPDPPSISVSPDAPVTNQNVTLTVSNIENGATAEYSVNGGLGWADYAGPVTLSQEGTYALTARQTNSAGGVSSQATTVNLTIDKSAPSEVGTFEGTATAGTVELTWNNPLDAGLAAVSEVELTWTPADGETQPVVVGAPNDIYTVSGLTSETSYTFTAVVVDEAGNRTGGTDTTVATLSPDPPAAPTVTFTPDVSVTNGTVTVTVSDTLQDATVQYSLNDGQPWQEYTVPFDLSAEGSYSVTARQTSASTGLTSDTPTRKSLVIDTTDPDQPGSFTATPGASTVDLSWSSPADNGPAGLAHIRITWDAAGGPSQPVIVTAPQSTESLSGFVAQTTYEFSAVAVDAAGNESAPVTDVVTTGEIFASQAAGTEIASAGFGPKDLATADVDLDGDIDVIKADDPSSQGQIVFNWNDGAGNIGSEIDIASSGRGNVFVTGTTVALPTALAVSDFDGDGDPDVAATWDVETGDRVVWYENFDETDPGLSSQFGFGTGTRYDVASAGRGNAADDPQDIIAADMDGDGNDDLVVAAATDGRVVWYENLIDQADPADPAFAAGVDIDSAATAATQLLVADFDGANGLDLLAVLDGSSTNEIRRYMNNGNGTFSTPTQATLPAVADQSIFRDIVSGDFDGDGDVDVVAVIKPGSAGTESYYFENDLDGSGGFLSPVQLDEDFASPSALHVADLDNDGDPDLLKGTDAGFEYSLRWYRNDYAGGTFDAVSDLALQTDDITAIDTAVIMIDTADLEGDGDLDIVVGIDGGTTDEFRHYENLLID